MSATEWVCPVHGNRKWVKPGISKSTGRPYTGFFCCTERGCEERPPKEPRPGLPAGYVPVTTDARAALIAKNRVAPNWDKIAEGKCRSLAICAWIQSHDDLSGFWSVEHEMIAYMMTGQIPGFDERTMNERWEDVPPPDADIPF